MASCTQAPGNGRYGRKGLLGNKRFGLGVGINVKTLEPCNRRVGPVGGEYWQIAGKQIAEPNATGFKRKAHELSV